MAGMGGIGVGCIREALVAWEAEERFMQAGHLALDRKELHVFKQGFKRRKQVSSAELEIKKLQNFSVES